MPTTTHTAAITEAVTGRALSHGQTPNPAPTRNRTASVQANVRVSGVVRDALKGVGCPSTNRMSAAAPAEARETPGRKIGIFAAEAGSNLGMTSTQKATAISATIAQKPGANSPHSLLASTGNSSLCCPAAMVRCSA